MRNEHRQSSGSGLLLGMAAGAALGASGTVTVNGEVLDEDYIAEPTYLGYDVEFPRKAVT